MNKPAIVNGSMKTGGDETSDKKGKEAMQAPPHPLGSSVKSTNKPGIDKSEPSLVTPTRPSNPFLKSSMKWIYFSSLRQSCHVDIKCLRYMVFYGVACLLSICHRAMLYVQPKLDKLMETDIIPSSIYISKLWKPWFCSAIDNKLPIMWHGWPWILIFGGPLPLLNQLSKFAPCDVNAKIMLCVLICCWNFLESNESLLNNNSCSNLGVFLTMAIAPFPFHITL